MTKAEALYNFFSGFGLTAYPTSSVPTDATFPYLTYENQITNGGRSTNPTVNLWYHTESEAVPNAKADEISKAIGGGASIPSDDGTMYVYFDGSWIALADANDASIKRRYTNMTIVFNTK